MSMAHDYGPPRPTGPGAIAPAAPHIVTPLRWISPVSPMANPPLLVIVMVKLITCGSVSEIIMKEMLCSLDIKLFYC